MLDFISPKAARAIEKIQDMLSEPELLCGLAEEAGELARAALKYRRTLTMDNPALVSKDVARFDLLEEFGYVLLHARLLFGDVYDGDTIKESAEYKAIRWHLRLQEKEEKR